MKISPSPSSPNLCCKMSQVLTKSPKHCAQKGFQIKKLHKKLLFTLSTFLLSLISFIFLVWLILHPSNPQFSLKQAEIYQLNLAGNPNLLNSSIQLTVLSKNPNKKVGIYYDELLFCASYKGQQITLDTPIPPFYQENEEKNVISASLFGTGLPVGPGFMYEVARDQSVGKLVLNLKGNGRLRWKIGSWVSGNYRFNVNCVSVMDFGPTIPTGPLSSKQGTRCSTSV